MYFQVLTSRYTCTLHTVVRIPRTRLLSVPFPFAEVRRNKVVERKLPKRT